MPEYSAWTAGERIEEAVATGAEALVTACGWCERNFLDSTNASGEQIAVVDILALVERGLAEPAAASAPAAQLEGGVAR